VLHNGRVHARGVLVHLRRRLRGLSAGGATAAAGAR
jgi:hypothetical protein